MPKRYQFSEEQIEELEAASRANKDKNAENRLKALLLRSQGKKNAQIGEACEYHRSYVSQLISLYCNQGLSVIVENHYAGNRRNISFVEEVAFLAEYKKRRIKGRLLK